MPVPPPGLCFLPMTWMSQFSRATLKLSILSKSQSTEGRTSCCTEDPKNGFGKLSASWSQGKTMRMKGVDLKIDMTWDLYGPT